MMKEEKKNVTHDNYCFYYSLLKSLLSIFGDKRLVIMFMLPFMFKFAGF
jgi:hypothetical protein